MTGSTASRGLTCTYGCVDALYVYKDLAQQPCCKQYIEHLVSIEHRASCEQYIRHV
jgi:hypothetical protein